MSPYIRYTRRGSRVEGMPLVGSIEIKFSTMTGNIMCGLLFEKKSKRKSGNLNLKDGIRLGQLVLVGCNVFDDRTELT